MKGKTIYTAFFALFILVGVFCAGYGLVKLAMYYVAEQVEATVLSAEYEAGEVDVIFTFERDGESVQAGAHYDTVKYENGVRPYYEGKEVTVRVDRANRIAQFGKAQILALVTGVAFTVAGTCFLYFVVLRKETIVDIAYEYEQAMVSPDELTDPSAKNEAIADQLSKLPEKSMGRMVEETAVWGRRMRDRAKTFTVWEHIGFCCWFLLPGIILGLYPLFVGRSVTFGYVVGHVFTWFFIACILGALLKIIYTAWWKLIVKLGKFSEKKLAVVTCSAFESSAYFQAGEFSRTHTIFKKFRVIATI
ncbi:MAG: hypothetical protein K2N74_05325, partial [Clostridiales bacterium]|nr:hypothetical protein [Clostridiales bacterium]